MDGALTERPGRAPKVVVYSSYPETHACAYIRIAAPMRAAGCDVVWAQRQDRSSEPFDVALAHTADFIVIQRQFPSLRTEKVLRTLFRLGLPVIYDLDDMLLDVPSTHPSYVELSRRAPYIKWVLKEVDLISVSTPELKRSLERYTSRPISVQPNLIDWALFDAQPRKHDSEFRFMISGTSTHQGDWAILERPLDEILAKHSPLAKALYFGEAPKRFSNHPSVGCIPFENDYRIYASRLKSLDVHAALVPLEDNELNRCKSNIKWLEYSTTSVPGAYSNLAPYQSCIVHRDTGLLVENTEAAWFEAMDILISDHEGASLMARNARRRVFEDFSIENSANLYATTVSELVGQKHRRQILAGISTFGARMLARARQAMIGSSFVEKHLLWRLNRRR